MKKTSKHSGKTIYIVRSGKDILFKSFSLERAKEELFDFNFPFGVSNEMAGLKKAKLFKAIVK